ncbi:MULTISPECIES: DUF5816 domain-containing protein [Halomicrobium]|uniref:GNAT family acetyltransferase n=1 Tax=Halomicrobium mukohataei TaxID=57705 RepID=A0A847TY00_9EURY|nr:MULTISPECIES: DUF5816 domain-containing protein [Halomicrobium]MBO4246356.1 GNAT family acetyltransferase [Halomicrobium sp. IBSBa]NLV10872.1 GNAT family acetyltransferase [Halomicrobium mukohataei]QGA82929.1 Uncharacterized protein LC1Hm_1887 [Halomicrobium sp. LC1Hm]
MERHDSPDGQALFVNRSESEIGSKGPFYVVYSDDEGTTRWGYFCSNCESVDNAMDAMGRVQCNECANVRKPDQWDAAHE